MNFFEMLILSQKLHLEDGKISFYGQDIVIFEPSSLAEYILEIDNNLELIKILYYSAKEAIIENKKNIMNIMDNYKNLEFSQWITKTVNLYAYGRIKFENSTDIENVILENSIIANMLKNKVKIPPDHILRGIIAGFVSIIKNKNLDCIEIECYAIGATNCKLIIGSLDFLKSKYTNLCEAQI